MFHGLYLLDINVTPRVGVWIETYRLQKYFRNLCVTPRVGVWIETIHLK